MATQTRIISRFKKRLLFSHNKNSVSPIFLQNLILLAAAIKLHCFKLLFKHHVCLTLNRPGGGGGIRPQAGSSLCCAETVSSRKLKLSDFYYILIGLNSEYKPVPWAIHCCHGNAIVEGCSVKFWLKSVENCIFLLKSFSNLSLGLLFVISISKLPPVPNFKQIGLKTKKLGFSTIFSQTEPKIQDDVIKTS